jgi:hypothetical protein
MTTELDISESRTHTLLTAPEDDAPEKGRATNGTTAVDESTILSGKKLAIVFVAM